ncbi:MAG: hypothetical protein ACYDHM_03955 [Acidiferrobacterales bacterium]
MRIRLFIGVAWALALLPMTAFADQVFITDRFEVPMRSAQASGAPLVKNLVSGTVLDLLAQDGSSVFVRDPQGSEGWVDAAAITRNAPATVQLHALRVQQIALQARLANAQAALARETARATGLANRQHVPMVTHAARPLSPLPLPATAAAAAPLKALSGARLPAILSWVALSAAMLTVGFFAGIIWLRQANRRKLGGMHLRI